MVKLEDSIGKTCYLMGYPIQATNYDDARFTLFEHKTYVKSLIKKSEASSLGDISLLHGTITRASSIPDEVNDNLDIFLLLPQANIELDSFMIQCMNLDHLQKIVSALITRNIASEDLEELIDDLSSVDIQNIEDLYILYGYEIVLTYSFEADDIDEEMLDAAKKTYEKIKIEQEK